METRGVFTPETVAEARERYEAIGPTAQVTVKEVAKAMVFDEDEYEERVTPAVIETARDVLFASLLEVHVGTRAEYESWLEEHDYEATELGSDHVESVVWHAAPFADEVAAATFQREEDAAVATLRRQAFGRIYQPIFADGSEQEADG